MAEQEPAGPDYLALKDGEIIEQCRDDASKWAAAFCQHAKHLGVGEIDEGWMIGWFANAIERSWQVRIERAQPETKPVTEGIPVQ